MTNHTTPKNGILNYFVSQEINKKGIVIIYRNREKETILFSDITKIFINKFKLTTSNKLVLIAIPFMSVFLIQNFIPTDFLFFVALFICIPIVTKIYNFKYYHFNIQLTTGTFYKKKFFIRSKQEHMYLVNLVRKEMFNYHSNLDVKFANITDVEVKFENVSDVEVVEDVFVRSALSLT
jgi:hypothetical protein